MPGDDFGCAGGVSPAVGSADAFKVLPETNNPRECELLPELPDGIALLCTGDLPGEQAG